jgi:hypothetical protein
MTGHLNEVEPTTAYGGMARLNKPPGMTRMRL